MAIWWIFPKAPFLRWAVSIYAALVAIATIYCRYHYAIDALAGVVVGLGAAVLVRTVWLRWRTRRPLAGS